jgi:hypothetical protein
MVTRRAAPVASRFRGLAMAAALACGAAAGSAIACRIGGDDLLFVGAAPAPPEGVRYSSIAFVHLEDSGVQSALLAALGDKRGVLVGRAKVLKVVRGPRLVAAMPAYLEVVTSCSKLGRSSGGAVDGYVVGQLKADARGPYLVLAERNDTTGAWR